METESRSNPNGLALGLGAGLIAAVGYFYYKSQQQAVTVPTVSAGEVPPVEEQAPVGIMATAGEGAAVLETGEVVIEEAPEDVGTAATDAESVKRGEHVKNFLTTNFAAALRGNRAALSRFPPDWMASTRAAVMAGGKVKFPFAKVFKPKKDRYMFTWDGKKVKVLATQDRVVLVNTQITTSAGDTKFFPLYVIWKPSGITVLAARLMGAADPSTILPGVGRTVAEVKQELSQSTIQALPNEGEEEGFVTPMGVAKTAALVYAGYALFSVASNQPVWPFQSR